MTEGQVFGARRKPGDGGRPPRRALAQLLSRLGLRRDEEARRHAAEVGARARVSWRGLAIDLNLQNNAERAVEDSLRQYGREYHAKQAAAVLMETDGSVARDGRRPRLWREPVQPRDRCVAPAGLLVQALCLRGPRLPAAASSQPRSWSISPVCIGNWCPKNYSGGFLRLDDAHPRR